MIELVLSGGLVTKFIGFVGIVLAGWFGLKLRDRSKAREVADGIKAKQDAADLAAVKDRIESDNSIRSAERVDELLSKYTRSK